MWPYQQPVFASAGYRVIGWSRRGHLGSDPVDPANPGSASTDLADLLDALGVGRFHLVASAAGGVAIGMMEALMAGYGTSLYAEPAIFLLILLLLFIRPYGLLGDFEAERR